MATKKELSVEDKLRAIYDLQLIDSRIDEIKNLRGELPLEVQDLEDEVEGLETRVSKFEEEIEELDGSVSEKKNKIKAHRKLRTNELLKAIKLDRKIQIWLIQECREKKNIIYLCVLLIKLKIMRLLIIHIGKPLVKNKQKGVLKTPFLIY